eukprot:CAMPEP_0185770466 /NCGR_PEP_ID=MMETSP1174-20130828/59255_1 /TAXON_ID=35687 /ORGANISM="Dictyocha speculum, Strain CCMP1381" /LENGTH=193 /DNA_ID=CAMNT_0028455901 /DNA_START=43 /DNA_END=624 /DNA_ORIENTATION=+
MAMSQQVPSQKATEQRFYGDVGGGGPELVNSNPSQPPFDQSMLSSRQLPQHQGQGPPSNGLNTRIAWEAVQTPPVDHLLQYVPPMPLTSLGMLQQSNRHQTSSQAFQQQQQQQQQPAQNGIHGFADQNQKHHFSQNNYTRSSSSSSKPGGSLLNIGENIVSDDWAISDDNLENLDGFDFDFDTTFLMDTDSSK